MVDGAFSRRSHDGLTSVPSARSCDGSGVRTAGCAGSASILAKAAAWFAREMSGSIPSSGLRVRESQPGLLHRLSPSQLRPCAMAAGRISDQRVLPSLARPGAVGPRRERLPERCSIACPLSLHEIHRTSRGTYGAHLACSCRTRRRAQGHAVGRKRIARPLACAPAGLRGHQCGARPCAEHGRDRYGMRAPERPGGSGSGRARLHRRRTRSALGRGHHLHPHLGRVPVPRRRAGCLQPPRGRLVHGQPPAHTARARCPRHGALAASARRRDPP